MTLQNAIIELWHISRIALATSDSSRYNRMIYVKNELKRTYPELITRHSGKSLWFEIENCIN